MIDKVEAMTAIGIGVLSIWMDDLFWLLALIFRPKWAKLRGATRWDKNREKEKLERERRDAASRRRSTVRRYPTPRRHI